ncbi:MAG: fused MFS/spermidine synthase [Bryobacteraceae bacterium]|nr:fused MFS/spermidine synthase [Bryobacteraceae bacterium]
MLWFYFFFLVSGFCSILYEIVWLRLAMAQFSVSTPFVSIVLAVFMLGLGAGSWFGGRWAEKAGQTTGTAGLRLYALTELLIGTSALLVPLELALGRGLVSRLAGSAPLDAGVYHLVAGLWIALAVGPWCACMGATFPFAMLAIRQRFPEKSERSFSYLYLANISGAVLGTLVPLFLVEAAGFRATLRFGLMGNLSVALCALWLARRGEVQPVSAPAPAEPAVPAAQPERRWMLSLVFATGLTTMGAEVVWVRLYTPYLGTVVYAFAAILGTYLLATYLGSGLYRWRMANAGELSGLWMAAIGLTVLLPLLACDPHWHWAKAVRVALGIVPFSMAAGYLTPMLLDAFSRGDPKRAGVGYAVNIAGCVAGPLVAGFLLLPLAGERMALLSFALPWLGLGLIWKTQGVRGGVVPARWAAAATVAAALVLLAAARSYEQQYQPRKVLRDHTATVVAAGATRQDKRLILNGVTTTNLTPITKFMAHLPLAFLPYQPQKALVICFGMGTTHRSVLSWGIQSTAVELTPSVPAMFSWFHADAGQLTASPLSRIVIDDGRAYLERARERFDVIILDPPPPVEAAASSLLYSKEFYAAAKQRLKPGGILQQWLPEGDQAIYAAVAKALDESFPHARVFQSVEGWGHHFLASETAIPLQSAAALAARMPERAAADLTEWGPHAAPEEQLAAVLRQELSLEELVALSPRTPALTDDRPINEYYLLRRWRW